MGHLTGKALYQQLGAKIDGLTVRVPWNEALYAILKELYSEEDAALVVKMPYGFSPIERLERITGIARPELERQLASACPRGLVIDVCIDGRFFYGPSPAVVGIFEYTMMRTGGGRLDFKKWAALFRDYIEEGSFFHENFGPGRQVSIQRTLPHEGTVRPDDFVEVLDYEKASAIVEASDRFSMGVCACRHERQHLGAKPCKAPLDNCSAFGAVPVDFMVRNGLGREVSKTEMLENIARSRELGLVLNADNVQRHVAFMCHCCSCCCNLFEGITKRGCPSTLVTSSCIACIDQATCKGCGVCSKQCPIQAIPRLPDPDPRFRKHGRPLVNEALCLGCGVCALKCKSGALKLHKRAQRVLHPESTFARVILQCLERGTLQNQLFDDPTSKTQAFLRGLVGGFLRLPPVKQALMSDALRSRFLAAMKQGARQLGKGRMTEV